jgi:hypothetical protein
MKWVSYSARSDPSMASVMAARAVRASGDRLLGVVCEVRRVVCWKLVRNCGSNCEARASVY